MNVSLIDEKKKPSACLDANNLRDKLLSVSDKLHYIMQRDLMYGGLQSHISRFEHTERPVTTNIKLTGDLMMTAITYCIFTMSSKVHSNHPAVNSAAYDSLQRHIQYMKTFTLNNVK